MKRVQLAAAEAVHPNDNLVLLAEKDQPARSFFDALLKSVGDEELTLLFEMDRLSGRIKDDDIALIRIEVTQE